MVIVLAIVIIVAGLLFLNYLDKMDKEKSKKDKEAIQEYTNTVLEQSNQEYEERKQRCVEYLNNGGSRLDKNFQLDCGDFKI